MTVPLLNNDDYCLRCGSCCGECANLTEDKLCSVYSNRPEDCMSIEEKAALVGLPHYCGYWQEAKRRYDKAVAINQGTYRGAKELVKSRNVESWEYSKAERMKFEGECEDKAREFLELNNIDYNPVNLYIAKHCFLLIETGSKDKMKALDRLYRWAEASGSSEDEGPPEGTVENIFLNLKKSGITEKQMRAQVRKVYKE